MKLFLAAFLGLLVVVTPACHTAAPSAETQTRTFTLLVAGMTSPATCPARVQAALSSVTGVTSASVDFETRTATAHCLQGCDAQALITALAKQGYGGRQK
jgi:copper chaperone CopZ